MITAQHVIQMINHWLKTPPNGYVGSSYGADLNSLLLKALTSNVADAFIAKMKQDLPLLQTLNSEQLALYSESEGFETTRIYLRVGDININLNKVNDQRQQPNGETFDVNAV